MKQTVTLEDGRKVTVLGTAHVSEESKREVRETVEQDKPDLVGVELDQDRYESLKEDSGWKDLDISQAIREGKGFMLFLNLILSIFQRRLGIKEGMKPGMELLEAVNAAEENEIKYSLIDRNINETLSRAFSELTLWEKSKLFGSLFMVEEDLEVEELKEQRLLDSIIEELEQSFPSLKRVFLDERNQYMADKILDEQFENALIVVGAAHVDGLIEELKKGEKYSVENRKKGFPWLKIFKYGIPIFILSMLGYSFYKIGFATGVQASISWILINGVLALLGAILARSHVLTWFISFVAAPLTSLDPALGAGMVASYAEGKFYPPKVEELESIAYIENYKDLWSNQVGRILLTFVFVSIGSATATFISAGYIASLII